KDRSPRTHGFAVFISKLPRVKPMADASERVPRCISQQSAVRTALSFGHGVPYAFEPSSLFVHSAGDGNDAWVQEKTPARSISLCDSRCTAASAVRHRS